MARSGLWGSFKVRRERPRRAPNLQIPLPDNCLVEPLAANGICQQRSTGARIGPTIGRATKAPIAALAPSTPSTTRLVECATMSTASGEPSISPGVEKKLLYAATAVRAPVPGPRLSQGRVVDVPDLPWSGPQSALCIDSLACLATSCDPLHRSKQRSVRRFVTGINLSVSATARAKACSAC
jgi:hypothetical protein